MTLRWDPDAIPEGVTLVSVDPQSGASRTIANYGHDLDIQTPINPGLRLSRSPDGKNLAATAVENNADIWMLEGFEQPPTWWENMLRR